METSHEEELTVCRNVLGAFETFIPAAVSARRLESDARIFERHIALDLSLPPGLELACANPGWENVTVHAFTLRAEMAGALNAQLRSQALELEKAGDGLVVSNVGAFHSRRLASGTRPLVRLRNAASRAARAAHADEGGARTERPRRPSSLWCNVSRAEHYHGLHDHDGAVWSGVYYSAVPPKPARASAAYSGRICFRTAVGGLPGSGLDGRACALDPSRPEGWCAFAYVDPQPGLMLLFPAWLMHAVLPVAPHEPLNGACDASGGGGQARVSYSFNFGEE